MSELVAPPSAWPDRRSPSRCTCRRRSHRRRRASRCLRGTASSSSALFLADLRAARLRRGQRQPADVDARRGPQRAARRSLARGALRSRGASSGPLPAVGALARLAPLLDRPRVRRLEPLRRTVQAVDPLPHRPLLQGGARHRAHRRRCSVGDGTSLRSTRSSSCPGRRSMPPSAPPRACRSILQLACSSA